MTQNFKISTYTPEPLNLKDAQIAYDVVSLDNEHVSKTQLILLINGFQRTRQDFRALRRKLAVECPDTLTVSFDNRFCGETKVLQNSAHTSLSTFAQDTLSLLKHCLKTYKVERIHVLGISMGGMIAQLLASLPECPMLHTLFLVSTTAGGAHRVWPSHELLQEGYLGADLSQEGLSKRLALYFRQKFLNTSPTLFQMFVKNMQQSFTSQNKQQDVQKQAIASKDFEGAQNLSQLRAHEIVIVTGDEDHIMPSENANIMARIIPNSHLIVYPQVGHLILIEHPDAFLRDIVKFLKKDPTVD